MKNAAISTAGLALALVLSAGSLASPADRDAGAAARGPIASESIDTHALKGELTTFLRPDGAVAAITFTSRKNGQIVALPKASIDRINEARGESRGEGPARSATVRWLRDFPGGGSVYEASSHGMALGMLIVQPDDEVAYVAF